MRYLPLLAAALLCAPLVKAAAESSDEKSGIDCTCEIKNVDLGAEFKQHAREMMEKYDKNKDGKLDKDEREAARFDVLKESLLACMSLHDRFDKNKDGKLGADEAAEMEKFVDEREGRLQTLFDRLDKNNDGKLSADDLKEAIEARVAQGLETWLQKYDKNDNGKLDDNETAELVADIAIKLEQQREEAWKKFDTDNDGKLSASERSAARKALASAFEKRHAELLAKYDKDHDGKLSADELKNVESGGIFCSCDIGGGKSIHASTHSSEAGESSATSVSDDNDAD